MHLTSAHIKTVHSWERDTCERTQLSLIHTEASTLLAFHHANNGESGVLQLSSEEAGEIGKVLLALADYTARWGAGQPPTGLQLGNEDCSQAPSLRVCMTNRGDPYEDGVLLDLQQPGRLGLYATLDKRQAHQLGEALASAVMEPEYLPSHSPQ